MTDIYETVEKALRKSANELRYCIHHFEHGSTPSMWGDQAQAADRNDEALTALRARRENGGIDINNIEVGDTLTYRDGYKATVVNICEKVTDGTKEGNLLHSARIMATDERGYGTYHTYRKDGVSQFEADGDIVHVQKSLPKTKTGKE